MDPDYFGIIRQLLGRPLRSSDIFYLIAGVLYFVLGLLAVVLDALNKLPCFTKWLSLILASVFLVIIFYFLVREVRERQKIIKKKDDLSEAWGLAHKMYDERDERVEWEYRLIDATWEVNIDNELKFNEEIDFNITTGALEFYQATFQADEKADPIVDFSKNMSVTLEGITGSGVELDCRINDLEPRFKKWFAVFPAGLLHGSPCKVSTKITWPGFWNKLQQTKRDLVDYEIEKKTEILIQKVVFPSSVTDENKDLVGVYLTPPGGDSRLETRDGRVVLVWEIQNPDVGQVYKISFDLIGVS